ncbi:MAG: hypothetical protein ABR981_04950 [Candidatus Micrarchaeaceae archaeon]|jgi:hypothetical protein
MALKQQSAIEFLVTYSIALLIIGIFIASVILISNTRPPVAFLGSSCNIQPLFPCQESLLTYNSITPLQYYLVFTNELGSVIYFPPNAINITTTNIGSSGIAQFIGNCTPSFASESSQVLCKVNIAGNVKPSIGQQTGVSFEISYNICKTSNSLSCAPGLYKSSGTSSQAIAPSSVNLYTLQFLTSPSGTIVLNGVTYFNGITAYFPSGNYVIFGSPPSSASFVSWNVNLPSYAANTASQNTTLTLRANSVITATFT